MAKSYGELCSKLPHFSQSHVETETTALFAASYDCTALTLLRISDLAERQSTTYWQIDTELVCTQTDEEDAEKVKSTRNHQRTTFLLTRAREYRKSMAPRSST